MTDAARAVDVGSVLGGRYRLLRSIAHGGMAQVWEAHDEILDRAVAVKVLHPHLAADDAFLERFRREAVAAARLAHPNVVATFDTGADDGVAYIVMELVEGPTLRKVLTDQTSLSPTSAVHIGAQVADALDYAHQAGIVHRDVKPANILICDDGRVKVADFGIAKAAFAASGQDLTQTGALLGTAKYLSPEQVDNGDLDRRSDVYALGVVVYEMVCGRPPFEGDTEMAVALQHLQSAPLGPRQIKAGIPRALEAAVLKALAKSPDDRYASAADLRSALLSVDDVPHDQAPDDATHMIARDRTPPSGVAPAWRRIERRWALPVALVVVVALVLGLVVVLLARSSDDGATPTDGATRQATPVRVVSATSFDPRGDGEHDDEVQFLFDGDGSTQWSTSSYSGEITDTKPGVGFVLQLDGRPKLARMEVSSQSTGWAASVYVADSPKGTLEEWGGAVDSRSDIDGAATFDLKGRQGGAVLVLLTDLGGRQASVGEVRLTE